MNAWGLSEWDFQARAIRSNATRADVQRIIDGAADNAADTCMEEGLTRDSELWEARYREVLAATICLLVDSTEVLGATARWFRARAAKAVQT